MRSKYRTLGPYIRELKNRNRDGAVSDLRGVSIGKKFMPSVANVNGTDLSKYKRVERGQFAFNPMHVGRDEVLPIALLAQEEPVIVSPAYVVFEILDHDDLLPEYLMMWCRRPEFDRNAWFTTDNSVRGGFSWQSFSDMELPIPSVEKQRKIVKEYQVVVDRIRLNERLNEKLEEAAQAIYKQWFVDFEFPMTAEYAQFIGKPEMEGRPYRSSGEETEYNEVLEQKIPKGWRDSTLGDACSKIGSGATPRGGKNAYKAEGTALVRSMNVHDYDFSYDQLAFIDQEQATKLANVALEEGDVLLNITGVSVARCCRVPTDVLPGYVNQHVAIIRPRAERSCYLVCLLCSTHYKQQLLGDSVSGSTRQALTKGDLERFVFLLPDESTGHRFEGMVKNVFEMKRKLVLESMLLGNVGLLLLANLAVRKTR